MQVTVEFPEDIAENLQAGWKDVERSALEAIAIASWFWNSKIRSVG
jgi:hypothetical protein